MYVSVIFIHISYKKAKVQGIKYLNFKFLFYISYNENTVLAIKLMSGNAIFNKYKYTQI